MAGGEQVALAGVQVRRRATATVLSSTLTARSAASGCGRTREQVVGDEFVRGRELDAAGAKLRGFDDTFNESVPHAGFASGRAAWP